MPTVVSSSADGTGATLFYDKNEIIGVNTGILCPYVKDSCTSDSTTKSQLWACESEKVSGSLSVGAVTLTQSYVGKSPSGSTPDYSLNTASSGTITFKIKCEYNKLGGCTGAT